MFNSQLNLFKSIISYAKLLVSMNILLAIIAGIGFGVAMFFRKLSVSRIGMTGVIFETVIEAILSVILIFILFPFSISDFVSKQSGIFYGIIAGIAATVGVIAFFLAAKFGPVSIPSIFTPVLSATTATLFAFLILGESLNPIKILGLIISLVGLFIFVRF